MRLVTGGKQWGADLLIAETTNENDPLAGPAVSDGLPDPRTVALRAAVARLHRELAAHPAKLPDRAIANEELAVLAAELAEVPPPVTRLQHSLLVIAGALGSVSALGNALAEVRRAVEQF